jgi:hypothetical protein
MAALKALLERLDMDDVVTYLNSGNVVFSSRLGTADVTRLLEGELARAFGTRIHTLVKTSEEMISIHGHGIFQTSRSFRPSLRLCFANTTFLPIYLFFPPWGKGSHLPYRNPSPVGSRLLCQKKLLISYVRY